MGPFRKTTAAVLMAAVVSAMVPARVLAQQTENTDRTKAAATPAKNAPADLPVSLDRIRRQLATKPRSRSSKDGLRLEYFVDVYGRAPRIALFTPTENVTSAPVMYGGMTHQEFLHLVTPEAFKSPPADIGAAIAALIKLAADKKKNKK